MCTDPEKSDMNRITRSSRSAVGMSLIEVLLALMILATTLIAYLTAMEGVSQVSQKGSYIAIATRAAANQIAQVQAANTSLVAMGTTNFTVAGLPSGSMTVVIGGNLNASNAALKTVVVTVTWNGTTSAPSVGGSVTLSTYVCTRR